MKAPGGAYDLIRAYDSSHAIRSTQGLFFFTAELGGSAQAFGAANSFASGLGLVSIMLQGIAVARLGQASGSAVLGGVANVVVVRSVIGLLVIGLSQAGNQVQWPLYAVGLAGLCHCRAALYSAPCEVCSSFFFFSFFLVGFGAWGGGGGVILLLLLGTRDPYSNMEPDAKVVPFWGVSRSRQ